MHWPILLCLLVSLLTFSNPIGVGQDTLVTYHQMTHTLDGPTPNYFQWLRPTHDNGVPVVGNLHWYWASRHLGTLEGVRIVGLLFHLLFVALVWIETRSLIASAFAATSPWILQASRLTLGTDMLCLILGTYMAARRTTHANPLYLIPAGILAGLTAYSYIGAWFTPALLLAIPWYGPYALALAACFWLPYLHHAGSTNLLSVFSGAVARAHYPLDPLRALYSGVYFTGGTNCFDGIQLTPIPLLALIAIGLAATPRLWPLAFLSTLPAALSWPTSHRMLPMVIPMCLALGAAFPERKMPRVAFCIAAAITVWGAVTWATTPIAYQLEMPKP